MEPWDGKAGVMVVDWGSVVDGLCSDTTTRWRSKIEVMDGTFDFVPRKRRDYAGR
jgi:hypothetical protein